MADSEIDSTDVLKYLGDLEKLDLQNCGIEDVRVLKMLKMSPKLKQVNLLDNSIKEEVVLKELGNLDIWIE